LAIINLTGNGAKLAGIPEQSTKDFYEGNFSGYANFELSKQSWQGTNFTYISGMVTPNSGNLTSYTFSTPDGLNSYTISEINYSIQPSDGLNLVNNLIKLPNPIWNGDQGNDNFVWYGSETIHGNGGLDSIDFTTNVSNKKSFFILNLQSDGTYKLTSGSYVTIFDGISRLKFNDESVALDVNGSTGTGLKVMGAILGSSSLSDRKTVGIVINFMDNQGTENALINLGLNFKLGSGFTNQQEVNLLYTNIYGKLPDALTNELLVSLLNNNFLTQTQFAYSAVELSQNAQNINLTGLNKIGIEYFPV
jgi:hypothetical protein